MRQRVHKNTVSVLIQAITVVCVVYGQWRFGARFLRANLVHVVAGSVVDSEVIGRVEGDGSNGRHNSKIMTTATVNTTANNSIMMMMAEENPRGAAAATPRTFHWNFLEPSISGVCGMNKCFFRSKKDPTKNGYLIAHHAKCDLDLGWEIAQRLEKKYGIHHLYLSPPQAVPVPSEVISFAKKIRKKAESTFFYKVRAKEFSDRANISPAPASIGGSKKDYKGLSYFKIQEVEVAPTPSLEWGDNYKRQRKCAKGFYSFARSIDDRVAFSSRLDEQIASLKILLWNEPWLLSDFQILIDQFGTIIHIDLDRKPKREKIERVVFRTRYVLASLKIISQKVMFGNRTISAHQSSILSHFPKSLIKQVC